MTDDDTALVLTKLGHSCVSVQRAAARVVVDPGVFSDASALDGADAVLVTHEHPDHLDVARVRGALERHPHLAVWGTPAVVDLLGGPTARVRVARAGDSFAAAGLDVDVVGEWHAVVHPDLPALANVGYLIGGAVLHPGDALTVPEGAVDTLLLPVSAPWLKLGEVIDYARAVTARQALPVHDTTYSPAALAIAHRQLGPDGIGIGATRYVPWTDGDRVVVAAD